MDEERRLAGRYHLLEPIGRGGMGVVWRAHDDLLDRTVAVKEVLYHPTSEEDRAAFNRRTIREARAAGRIDHPNVVVVHDVIEEDGRPWIVMQLVQSRSLGQVLREQGPLPPARVAAIGLQVLDALCTAHAAGVLHRDVKPENVLLKGETRVVLTDFGIATMPEETGLTMTGGITGTPAFIPPERLNGHPATPESDLWSLGATLYAAVEGRTPFDRNSAVATMAAVLHDDPAPPRRAGALTPVLEGLLRKDPARRIGATEAAALLDAAVSAGREPVPPGPPPPYGPQPYSAPTYGSQPYGAQQYSAQQYSAQQYSAQQYSAQQYSAPTAPPGGHAAPTAPGPPAARRGSAGRTTLFVLLPLLLVVVLAVGGWYGYSRQAGGIAAEEPTPAEHDPTAEAPRPSPSDAPSPRRSTTTASGLPSGWKFHRDRLGFSIALPSGWVPFGREATRVRFRHPSGRDYLQVDLTPWDTTDPVAALRQVEAASTKMGYLRGYERIGITRGTYLDVPAADWEFTHTTDAGRVRVLDRAFRTEDGRCIALYWQAADSRWTTGLSYFRIFERTFQPE
ncbi:serine/threonine-protein kinase [Microbispora sp. H11081]|uniref:serine/threonine-protein kinase n=1 Tax=Microbispora sp. H11081 TaxID=2729107 RepID=UPI001B8B111B|nr:serine/threonine-protein kinase [Microbispora sp. H11081]